MTDERKEGQQYCYTHKKFDQLNMADCTTQPEPRGSEALREALECAEKYKAEGLQWREIAALRMGEISILQAKLAAATAERTTLATESPVAETVAIGTGDSYAGSQSHQNAAHQPAPPQPEAPEKEKP